MLNSRLPNIITKRSWICRERGYCCNTFFCNTCFCICCSRLWRRRWWGFKIREWKQTRGKLVIVVPLHKNLQKLTTWLNLIRQKVCITRPIRVRIDKFGANWVTTRKIPTLRWTRTRIEKTNMSSMDRSLTKSLCLSSRTVCVAFYQSYPTSLTRRY